VRQVPASIAAALNDFENNTPHFFIDFYLDNGPEKVLASQADWAGVGDAAAGGEASTDAAGLVTYTTLDTDLTVNDNPGVLQLAKGSLHALFAGSATGTSEAIPYSVRVRDNYSNHWLWGYKHLSTTRTVLTEDVALQYAFTGGANQVVDSVGFFAHTTATIGTARSGILRIVEASTGNQVGRAVSFTPAGSSAAVTVSGLAAFIRKGGEYYLEIDMVRPDPATLRHFTATTVTYTFALTISQVTLDSATVWTIPVTSASGFNLSGNEGFQAAGDGYRTLDIGGDPTGLEGYLSFKDTVPIGTTLTIDLYYTSDSTLAETAATTPVGTDPATEWVKLTAVTSGLDLTSYAYRYWRLHAQFTSNSPTNDETPRLDDFKVAFRPVPVTYGTISTLTSKYVTAGAVQQEAYDSLHKISTLTSEMSPTVPKSLLGTFRVTLASDENTDDLTAIKLKGKEARARLSFEGLTDSLFLYGGIVEDLSYQGGLYQVDLIDSLQLSDVTVPSEKFGEPWVATTAYSIGDTVVFGQVGYTALTNNTNVSPDSSPTDWQDDGSVWSNITYSGTHLADALADFLTNQINIPAERINLASLDAVKNRYPNLTIDRTIADPVKALAEIGEAAWLLRSKFVSSGGKLTLVHEPGTDSVAIDLISGGDIVDGSVRYAKGYKGLYNACYIATGYAGTGNGPENFNNGFAVVDADSAEDYKGVWLKDYTDKWGVFAPEFPVATVAWADATGYVQETAPGTPAGLVLNGGYSWRCILSHTSSAAREPGVGADWPTYWERNEVLARARDFVSRNKDGRIIVQMSGIMRLALLEGGDVVDFESEELPPNERKVRHRVIVVSNNADFDSGTTALTLLGL